MSLVCPIFRARCQYSVSADVRVCLQKTEDGSENEHFWNAPCRVRTSGLDVCLWEGFGRKRQGPCPE